jgi:hypothetical protein
VRRTAWLTGSLLFLLSACQLPPERTTLQPLPEDGLPQPYARLLTRARDQAYIANYSFYDNNWTGMEDAARGLEQTARFLVKAEDVPPNQKDALPVVSGDLAAAANKLLEAAKAKDVDDATKAMATVHRTVRGLRLDTTRDK